MTTGTSPSRWAGIPQLAAAATLAALSFGVAMRSTSPRPESAPPTHPPFKLVRCPVAARLFEEANLRIQRSEFREAHDKLRLARVFDPEDEEIRSLYREVSRILTAPPSHKAVMAWDAKPEIRCEEACSEALEHLKKGKKLMEERRYAAAEAEFRAVEQKLKWVPYDRDMDDALEEAKVLAAKAHGLQKAAEDLETGDKPR